jgi:NAD(P)-dependent dehydrogenase (short-subunit alcohol dehydrogenase family)
MQDTLKGEICLVTGASRGIGFYTAQGLARRGAHVILVGHHQGRGEKALDRIRNAVGEASVEFICANLAVQDQVRSLAEQVQQRHGRLDVLVNNAGGFFLRRQESADGIEMTWALNHLAAFLLTNLLLDMLQDSAPARVVNVSSESHRNARIHFEDLQMAHGYNAMEAYGQSKLANLLFTYELARRLEGTGVTANALHPGFVNTHIGKQHWLVRPILSVIHFFFARSPEEGAETPLYLASSPEVAGVDGQYFIDKEAVESSPASRDPETAQRLWTVSEKMTGLWSVASL